MLWVSDMLVRDRIAGFHAEAAHDRLIRALTPPVTPEPQRRPRAHAWWRRLIGLRIRVSRQDVARA